MTILEMLDILEGGIVLLRGKNESLSTELSNASSQLARSPIEKSTKRAGRRRPGKKPLKGRKTSTSRKSAATAEPASHVKEHRVLGKRQALGRSILQIRKATAVPQPDKPDPEDDAGGILRH